MYPRFSLSQREVCVPTDWRQDMHTEGYGFMRIKPSAVKEVHVI